MYSHIYIYIYTQIHVCIYCIYIYIHNHAIKLYVYIYIYIYLYHHISMYNCIYCVHIYIYTFIYTQLYIYIYIVYMLYIYICYNVYMYRNILCIYIYIYTHSLIVIYMDMFNSYVELPEGRSNRRCLGDIIGQTNLEITRAIVGISATNMGPFSFSKSTQIWKIHHVQCADHLDIRLQFFFMLISWLFLSEDHYEKEDKLEGLILPEYQRSLVP